MLFYFIYKYIKLVLEQSRKVMGWNSVSLYFIFEEDNEKLDYYKHQWGPSLSLSVWVKITKCEFYKPLSHYTYHCIVFLIIKQ